MWMHVCSVRRSAALARAYASVRHSRKEESMTATNWMQIAALASALGLAGTEVAIAVDGTTSTDSRSASSPGMDTPSSGAIVTPEDKAMGLGKHNDDAGNRNGDVNEDTSTPNDNSMSTQHDNASAPARTGSDVQPGDMGPGNVRGE
jgi:hypothetical protein